MDKSNVRLYEKCHDCVLLSKGSCKGKESSTPCIVYQSKEEYRTKKLKDIREMIVKDNRSIG